MILDVQFAESNSVMDISFGELHEVSDGGYDKGYTEGYDKGVENGYSTGYTEGETKGKEIGYDEGYDKGVVDGYTDGELEGKEIEWNRFWDNFQAYGKRVDYRYAFAYDCWNDENYNPKYPITQNGYAHTSNLFNTNDNITDTKVSISILGSTSTNQSVFNACTALVRIPKLILGGNASFNSWFNRCSALKDITIEGSIDVTISFAWSPLSVESMKSIISTLKNYSDTDKDLSYTLTFTEACWTALEADSTAPDGNTWKEYVVNTLGWNM